MRILMFGIHELGAVVLERLIETGYRPEVVVTKPNEDTARTPLVEIATSAGIPIWQPEGPQGEGFLELVRELAPELTIVAGYHKKIPARVLEVPRRGTINVHGSLLPSYRGPSTWKQAILNGESRTGVTIHVMTPELDRGDILAQVEVPIDDCDTGGSLFLKLCRAGADLLPDTLAKMESGQLSTWPQDEQKASYFSYIGEQEARVQWSQSGASIRNLARALDPRPGAWTMLNGERVGVRGVEMAEGTNSATPGEILEVEADRLKVATGDGSIWLRTPANQGWLERGMRFAMEGQE